MKQIYFVLLILTFSIIPNTINSIVVRFGDKNHTYTQLDGKSQTLAQNSAFDCVGKLHLIFSDQTKSKFVERSCSGTLIDARTVLTSADCIEPLVKDKTYSFFQGRGNDDDNTFILGNDAWNQPIASARVISGIYYHGYTAGISDMDAQNLALLFLNQPITHVEPAKLYDQSLEELYDKKVVFVGFGFAGNPVSGIKQNLDFLKRAGEQKIIDYKRTMLQTKFTNNTDYLSGMFTHGDQGGPMFYEAQDGQWYLVGVNAFRLPPAIERKSKAVKEDPRYVPYGSIGYSIGIPPHLKWIKKNMGQKIAQRISEEDSEWNFHPFWTKHRMPNNEDGSYFKALVDKKGILLINEFFEMDKLIIDHPNARVFLPHAHMIAQTSAQKEAKSEHLFKEGKFFELVEYERSLLKVYDENHVSLKAGFVADAIQLNQGQLQVDGELWFEELEINGGKLIGAGELIHGSIPVINKGGKVRPGVDGKLGILKIWGDYVQLDKDQTNSGGILSIRVEKSINKNNQELLSNDLLKVMGHASLGGTLEIIDNTSALRPEDKIQILHAQAIHGKFSHIKIPYNLRAQVEYGSQAINIKFFATQKLEYDRVKNTKLSILPGQELFLRGASSFDAIHLNGGVLNGSNTLTLENGPLLVSDGLLRAYSSAIVTGEFKVQGDYHQQHGILAFKMLKDMEQKNIDLSNEVRPMVTQTHDSLVIQGKAHLGGQVSLQVDPRAIIEHGSVITILRAQEIEGQFDDIEAFPSVLQPALLYSPTQTQIQFNAGKYRDVHELTSLKHKQMAKSLDELRNIEQSKEVRTLFLILDRANKSDLPGLFDKYESYIEALLMKQN